MAPTGKTTTKTSATKTSATFHVAPSAKASSPLVAKPSGKSDPDSTKSGLPLIQHGSMNQTGRAFNAASVFFSGIMAIAASQLIGAPLKLVDSKVFNSYMALTKESFAVLVTTITQLWAPTVVKVSGDASMKGQLYQMDDGTLKCNFPHRLVLMANHQLYTDWLYLWWIAYTNKMHGKFHIILKESLKQIPIVGWGCQFYNFIFLSRKWETDRHRFKDALSNLSDPNDPMWLLIFPEGTNLSEVTKQKSAAWSLRCGIPDMKNQLLPRTTGLHFCLQELKQTTNWLYDCTIAYEGIPKGHYGQDIFTLRSSFLDGRPPKSVNMFWRRFKISNIPLHSDEAFSRWLVNRWREKDYILEYFYKFGRFPAEEAMKALEAVAGRTKPNHAKMIETEVKSGGWDEFLSTFGPVTKISRVLSAVDMTEPAYFNALMEQIAKQHHVNLTDLEKLLAPATGQDVARNILSKSAIDRLTKQALRIREQKQLAAVNKVEIGNGNNFARIMVPGTPNESNRRSGTEKSTGNVSQDERLKCSRVSATKRRNVPNPTPISKLPKSMASTDIMVNARSTTSRLQSTAPSVRNGIARRKAMKSASLSGESDVTKEMPTVDRIETSTHLKEVPAKVDSVPTKATIANKKATGRKTLSVASSS